MPQESVNTLIHHDRDMEFDYMISEIEHERRLIDERWRRLEQIITYYLTIITAVIGAAIAAAVATSGTTFNIVLILVCMIATTVGHFAFIAILVNFSGIVASLSHMYMRRQYFLDIFPTVRKYVEYRSNSRVRELWRIYFGTTTKLFLWLFSLFNCALLGIFLFGVLTILGQFMPSNLTIPDAALAGVVFLICFVGEIAFISRRINRARDLSHAILQNFPSES